MKIFGIMFTAGELIGLLAICVTCCGAWFAWLYFSLPRIESLLNEPSSRKLLADELKNKSKLVGYTAALRRLNGRFDRYFGTGPAEETETGFKGWRKRYLGVKAFGRCLILAYCYPLLLYMLAWVIGGSHVLSGVAIFPPGLVWPERALLALVMIGFGIVLYYYFKSIVRISKFLTCLLIRGLEIATRRSRDSFVARARLKRWREDDITVACFVAVAGAGFGFVAGVVAGFGAVDVAGAVAGAGFVAVAGVIAFAGFGFVAGAGAVAGVVAVAVAGVVALAGAVAGVVAGFIAVAGFGFVAGAGVGAGVGVGALAGAVAGVGAVAGAVAVAGVGAGVGAVTVAVTGFVAVAVAGVGAVAADIEAAFVFGFFILVLPYANAMADWLSLGATRWLLQCAERAEHALSIFKELMFDLVFAYICLMLLAALIPTLIELFNLLFTFPRFTAIDWRSMIDVAIQNPFSDGILLWGMLLTTLIPTIFHLIAGLIGMVAVTTNLGTSVAKEIEDVVEWNSYTRQEISRRVFAARIGGSPRAVAVIFFVIIAALIYFTLFEIRLLGFILLYIADTATFWAR